MTCISSRGRAATSNMAATSMYGPVLNEAAMYISSRLFVSDWFKKCSVLREVTPPVLPGLVLKQSEVPVAEAERERG